MAQSKTLENLRDVYYAILKEQSDSSAYPLTLADVLINNAQTNICSWNLINTIINQQVTKWSLPFLFEDKYYTSVQDIYVWTTMTTADTEITVTSTSWFASSWFLYIDDDIIQYTWVSATQFTWVTWIGFAHLAGARISQLFSLPTDYATSNRVIYNNQRTLKYVDYRNLYLNLNNEKGTYPIINSTDNEGIRYRKWIYTIIKWSYFLPINIDASWYMIHQIYEKKPTTLSTWTDISSIPDEYAESTIPFVAAWKTLFHRWEEQRWIELLNYAYWEVASMYTYYDNQNIEEINWQRIQTWKDMYLNI